MSGLVIVNRLPDYWKFDQARIGSFSITNRNDKYVAVEDLHVIGDKSDTISTHYRDFVKAHDLRFPKKGHPEHKIAYPYYAIPHVMPDGVYIDIKSAFQQIAYYLGYEVWYVEGKAIAYGETLPIGEVFNVKAARGLLVTSHLKEGKYTLWKNKDLSMVRFSNANYAPYFTYAIWSVLHAIMYKLKPYIYYAHTDGIICSLHMVQRVERTLQDLGFTYTIKGNGLTRIRGVGSYQIGDKQTLNTHQSKGKRDGILDHNPEWWIGILKKAMERREPFVNALQKQ